jgi:DNA-binding XRE family transcriptional regulator
MSKDVSYKNRDRFIQLGIAISTLRKMRGLSQEKLAEKAGITRFSVRLMRQASQRHFRWKCSTT